MELDECQRREVQPSRRLEFDDLPETETDSDAGDIHSSVPNEHIPQVGMVFLTEDDAYNFYNLYAMRVGFSIRRFKAHKDKATKWVFDRTFCCSREGKRGEDKRSVLVKRQRVETRCGCRAMMKVNSRRTGKYEVVSFIPEHNHDLSTPSNSHLHRSHRRISHAEAVQANSANSSGEVAGRENLGEGCKNYLQSKRVVQMRSGDAGGVLEYLQKMKSEDSKFFYALQLDEDDLITNIFWTDAKMMIDYAYFGDVVSFDTTYRKHKDGRPLALFVGVNHHRQAVIFGAALLYDETAETFSWLFATLAKAMSGKKPMTVLTDQSEAMAKALSSQWPETHHRLCILHIYQNAVIHLGIVFVRFKEFSDDFNSCVYDYEDEDNFINAWNEMLAKYDLQENEWLTHTFNIKEKWALVYGRQFFCADITIAQRSESLNGVVKKYVSNNHDILKFFQLFESLVDDRRDKELRADFKATQSTPSYPEPIRILKHAASVYTHEVFDIFLGEWYKSHDCKIEILTDVGMVAEYKITPYEKHYFHSVSYDSSDDTVLCSCKRFEFTGILCSHALKVYTLKSVVRIPAKYILKRWTKKAKTGNVHISLDSPTNDDSKTITAMRYKELCQLYTLLITRASETDEAYKVAKKGFSVLMEEMDAAFGDKVIEQSTLGNSNMRSVSKYISDSSV